MVEWPTYEYDDRPGWTPEEVRETAEPDDPPTIESMADYAASTNPFEELLTPTARAAILDVLIRYGTDSLTVTELCEQTDQVSKATFTRHKDDLLALGVMETTGKKGNAQTYRANIRHPAVQLLKMLQECLLHGKTPLLLEERFIE